MNLSNIEKSNASSQFIGDISQDIKTAVDRAFSKFAGSGGRAVVADGKTELDAKMAQDHIAAGHTFAILNARAGQLSTVFPGTGIAVPQDVALFAVKRLEIPGHQNRYHTIVTMVSHPESVKVELTVSSADGSIENQNPSTPSLSVESIAEALAQHVAQTSQLDSSLIPPNGACFGILTFTFPWSGIQGQPSWAEARGAQQTYSFSTTQSYYVYYANGDGENPPLYVILMTQSGNASPAQNGAGGLCSNSSNERAYVLATNSFASYVKHGDVTLVAQSPSATTSTPVTSNVSYPMTVMAQGPGGMVSTAFTAASSDQTGNPDWGVYQLGGLGSNAGWVYYNFTGWNASTQTVSNFPQWWNEIYDSNGYVVQLDSQCMNGGSFNAKAIWTIPQNKNNQAPLKFQLNIVNTLTLVGFANSEGTGNGYSQMGQNSVSKGSETPTWDLVALTRSQQS